LRPFELGSLPAEDAKNPFLERITDWRLQVSDRS